MAALTRRSLVAAAAPAAILAAAAPAYAASRFSGPDAELLQLAEEFECLHDQWQALDEVSRRLEAQADALNRSGSRALKDLWRHRKATGADDAIEAVSSKLEQLDAVANRMRALPARTLEGLVVKARLAQFDTYLSCRSSMAGPEADWDWDVRCMAHFVREVRRFAESCTAGGLHA